MTAVAKSRKQIKPEPVPLPMLASIVEEASDVAGQPRGRRLMSIDTMLRKKSINSRQHEAARRLQDDWEIIQGATDYESFGVPSGGRRCFEPTETMLDAAKRYRLAVQRIGQRLEALVKAVVIDGKSVRKEAGKDCQRQLMGKLKHALDEIGDVYGLPGG